MCLALAARTTTSVSIHSSKLIMLDASEILTTNCEDAWESIVPYHADISSSNRGGGGVASPPPGWLAERNYCTSIDPYRGHITVLLLHYMSPVVRVSTTARRTDAGGEVVVLTGTVRKKIQVHFVVVVGVELYAICCTYIRSIYLNIYSIYNISSQNRVGYYTITPVEF